MGCNQFVSTTVLFTRAASIFRAPAITACSDGGGWSVKPGSVRQKSSTTKSDSMAVYVPHRTQQHLLRHYNLKLRTGTAQTSCKTGPNFSAVGSAPVSGSKFWLVWPRTAYPKPYPVDHHRRIDESSISTADSSPSTARVLPNGMHSLHTIAGNH